MCFVGSMRREGRVGWREERGREGGRRTADDNVEAGVVVGEAWSLVEVTDREPE